MFDLTSSKLLILGIVALLVVGPKDLPMLLRTIGKYVGIIRKQATEFRAQFDEAMRDTELDQIRKDVAAIKAEAQGALREVTTTVDTSLADAKLEVEKAAQSIDATQAVTSEPLAPLTPTPPDAVPEPALSPAIEPPAGPVVAATDAIRPPERAAS